MNGEESCAHTIAAACFYMFVVKERSANEGREIDCSRGTMSCRSLCNSRCHSVVSHINRSVTICFRSLSPTLEERRNVVSDYLRLSDSNSRHIEFMALSDEAKRVSSNNATFAEGDTFILQDVLPDDFAAVAFDSLKGESEVERHAPSRLAKSVHCFSLCSAPSDRDFLFIRPVFVCVRVQGRSPSPCCRRGSY